MVEVTSLSVISKQCGKQSTDILRTYESAQLVFVSMPRYCAADKHVVHEYIVAVGTCRA